MATSQTRGQPSLPDRPQESAATEEGSEERTVDTPRASSRGTEGRERRWHDRTPTKAAYPKSGNITNLPDTEKQKQKLGKMRQQQNMFQRKGKDRNQKK